MRTTEVIVGNDVIGHDGDDKPDKIQQCFILIPYIYTQRGETIKASNDDNQEKILEEITKQKGSDAYPLLIRDSIPDFAKFWAASVVYLHNNSKTFLFKMILTLPQLRVC